MINRWEEDLFLGAEQVHVLDMKTFSNLAISIVSLVFLIGCSGSGENSSGNTIALGEVKYIQSFPKEVRASKPREIRLDNPGALDIVVHKGIIYTSGGTSPKVINGYDANNGRYLGCFFSVGNGPDELLYSPYLCMCTSYEKDGHLVYDLNDGKNHLLTVDFTESLACGKAEIISSRDLSMSVMHCLGLPGHEEVYGSYVNPKRTGFDRFLLGSEGPVTIPAMDRLNDGRIKREGDGFLFNIVGFHAGYNVTLSRILEVSIYLNTIHLYDLSGEFARTVCIGKRMNDIDKIEDAGLQGMNEIFMKVMSYPDFFAVLSDESVRTGEKGAGQSILVFDWEGNALVKVDMDRKITAFAFDLDSNKLYAYDQDKTGLWIYELPSFS